MVKNEMCHLENLSTITNMESLPFLDLGKPKIKYIEISTQGSLEISKGVYNALSHVGERRQGG
jgi:hypothetical protein